MISLSVSRRTLLAAAAAAGFVMTPLAKAVAAAVDPESRLMQTLNS